MDGIFGSATDSAVKRFQKDQGLTVDGIVGPKTWAKLEEKIKQKQNQSNPLPDGPLPPPFDDWESNPGYIGDDVNWGVTLIIGGLGFIPGIGWVSLFSILWQYYVEQINRKKPKAAISLLY